MLLIQKRKECVWFVVEKGGGVEENKREKLKN